MIVMYHQQLYNVLSTRKQKHLNHIIVLYLSIYPLMIFKYAKGKMAFEYIDAETGDILDILEGRDGLKDLRQVESITIDMNAGYVNVIKEIFPQAKIISDRFHLVQLISRSMNKTRVRVMNTLKTSNGEP